MDYLDSRNVRIYIHDPSKNMFYELEDLRYASILQSNSSAFDSEVIASTPFEYGEPDRFLTCIMEQWI